MNPATVAKIEEHLRRPPPLPASITAAELKHKVFAPVRFAVDGLVADGLTIMAGKPKLGKSWAALDFGVSVATGGYALDSRKCGEGDVLYAALEDGERRLRARLDKRDTWPERLTFWTEMEGLERGGLDQLRGWCAEVPDPQLVIIDTFAKVRSPKGRDEQQYDADYRQAGALKALADSQGVAVLLIHHTRKMDADDPLDTLSGTTGLSGAADTIIVLKRGADGVTLYARGRDVEEIELAVEFQKDTAQWRVLGDASDVRRSAERTAILDAMKAEGEPMTPLEVTAVTGKARVAVRRLMTKMAKDGELKSLGKGKYALP